MLEVSVPGYRKFRLSHLVLDYNGTIAFDGNILQGAKEGLEALKGTLRIHVVTADTFGKAAEKLAQLPCSLHVLPPGDQDIAKREYVESLGKETTVSIGNGRNDGLMLKESALGIALVQQEGAAVSTLLNADVVCPDIESALGLLRNHLRLAATLRS